MLLLKHLNDCLQMNEEVLIYHYVFKIGWSGGDTIPLRISLI